MHSERDAQWVHYCIVRADIPPGNQAAQLIHAAGESSPGRLPSTTFAVALHARDEAHLRGIAARLELAGIEHHRIVEDDPPFCGQLLAVGVAPTERGRVRRLLSDLPLVK